MKWPLRLPAQGAGSILTLQLNRHDQGASFISGGREKCIKP
jgi:hypothetical protein